jgi:hypothetical protein
MSDRRAPDPVSTDERSWRLGSYRDVAAVAKSLCTG